MSSTPIHATKSDFDTLPVSIAKHTELLLLLSLMPLAAGIRVLGTRLGFFGYDLQGFADWMAALQSHSWSAFYSTETSVPPDHLPGTLWILSLASSICEVFGIPVGPFDPATHLTVKAIGICGDLLVGLLLFLVVRQFLSGSAPLLAAAAWWFNPAPILISSLWGQIDSVSLVFVLAGLLLALRSSYAWALVLITAAALMKPQLAIIGLCIAAYAVLKIRNQRGSFAPLVHGLLGSVALVTAAGWPFSVSLVPGLRTWTYFDRLDFAVNRYDSTSLGALSLWSIPVGTQPPPSDGNALIGWLTYAMLANLLVAAALGVAALVVLRSETPEAGLLTGACLAMWGACIFATRMHERYFIPALLLLILLAAIRPQYRLLAIVMTGVFSGNLYLAFTYHDWSYPLSSLRTGWMVSSLSSIAVVGWIVGVAIALLPESALAGIRTIARDRFAGTFAARTAILRLKPPQIT